MAYTKQNFVAGQTLTADAMNHIEQGIYELSVNEGSGGGSAVELASASGKSLIISNAKSQAPEELKVVGFTEAYKKSKNLFDPVYAADKSNYTQLSVGGVTLKGLTFQLKPNTTYTMSRVKIEGLSTYQNINIGTTSKRVSLLNSASGTVTTLDDGLLYFGGTGDSAIAYLSQYTNIQLEEGASATDYEPYVDKQGFDNAGNLDEVSGKYVVTLTFDTPVADYVAVAKLDAPLSKWDSVVKKNGVWGVSDCTAVIDSYNGESIPGEFVTVTGELVQGEGVQYKTAESFTPFDADTNSAFNSLKFDGITKVFSDCDVNIDVTYEVREDKTAEAIYVSVKDYGAIGDGVTDDTGAIRKARDFAVVLKKPLYFPAGRYLLTQTIQMFSGMHIIGEKGSVITKHAAVTQNLVENAPAGATSVKVSDASAFQVGWDIYIGGAGLNGGYADTVGYITEVDASTNTISFDVYPRHSLDPKAGLNREVTTAGIVSSTFSMLCAFSAEDAGGNLLIEGLEFDGNRQASEAQMYSLSPINTDPNKLYVTVRDCKVVNSPADGISLQNNGQTLVDNCVVDSPKYHGIHPGYSHNGVSITNCFIYNCPNSGVYDCYNVNGMTVSNCYIVDCYIGVGGLDDYSNGSNIVGCTFEKCTNGVEMRATFGGANVTGCSFQQCGVSVSAYVGGHGAVNGCVFTECDSALKLQRSSQMVFSGNTIKDCKTPIICDVQPSNPAIRNKNVIVTGNVVNASANGTKAMFEFNNLDNAIVKNNILVGNNSEIIVDKGTTSGLVIEDNIGTVIETGA